MCYIKFGTASTGVLYAEIEVTPKLRSAGARPLTVRGSVELDLTSLLHVIVPNLVVLTVGYER